MPDGTGLSRFQKNFPDRFFDVGIAEEHAVTFAAGLASVGFKPVVSIYSSFYQRAYDQILHDVCLQNLPVVLVVDRAGLVGQDGETHQGIFDISFLSAIPNMTIFAPKDARELKEGLKMALAHNGPVAIRFSRGDAYVSKNENNQSVSWGKSNIVSIGEDIAIISVGSMYEEVVKASEMLEKEGIKPTIVSAGFIKPIDYEMVDKIAGSHKTVVIVEEGIKKGGYGEAIETYIHEHNIDVVVKILAIDDIFVEQGSVDDLRNRLGISA
jgi:1-deoxy-D-xylulose-5-phosphate synthase